MRKLVTKAKFETLVIMSLAFVTVVTFSALFHAVLRSQPVV
jgi:Na+-transporting NADH:ubiquinone oxidoreductase subunit NqrD